MKLNKTIAKTLVFAMALGSLSYLNSAKTEVFASGNLPAGTFDGAKGTITFTANASYWGVAKKLKSAPKKNQDKYLKMGEKDWYQVKTLDTVVGKEIDLGKYAGKNVTIAVGSKEDFADGAENWKIFDLKASNKAFKAFYSFDETKVGKITTKAEDTLGGAYGFLSFFDGKDSQVPLAKIKTDLEVKSGAGDWQLATTYFNIATSDNDAAKVDKKVDSKLKVLVQRGAKLSFRLKGSNAAWGSKEAKITISSQKNGPNVKLDVDKNLSNLKKDYLFATILDGADIPESLTSKAKGKDDFKTLGIKETDTSAENLAKKQILIVQEPKSTKMASKLTKIYITRQAAPTINDNLATANEIGSQGEDIIENELTFKLNVPYDVKKGASLINKSTNDYEFFVDYEGNTAETDIKKWVKIKKPKSTEKPTVVRINYADSKKNNAFKPNQSKIYVRKPGIKQVGNDVTLASAPINAAIKVSNIAQVMTIETQAGDDFAPGTRKDDPNFTLKFDKAAEKEYTIKAKISNVTKKSGKPKFKITAPAPKGVKVSVEALSPATTGVNEKDAIFDIKVSIDSKAFPEDPTGTMKFKIDHESLSKEYTVTFSKKAT